MWCLVLLGPAPSGSIRNSSSQHFCISLISYSWRLPLRNASSLCTSFFFQTTDKLPCKAFLRSLCLSYFQKVLAVVFKCGWFGVCKYELCYYSSYVCFLVVVVFIHGIPGKKQLDLSGSSVLKWRMNLKLPTAHHIKLVHSHSIALT